MTSNNSIILDRFLESDRQEKYSSMPQAEHFEIFCSDQVLKDYDLSDDEIRSGIVGGGDDGGIDAMYTFLDRDLVQEDTDDYSSYKKNLSIELFIIQAKATVSFSESALDKLASTTDELLDLSKSLSSLKNFFNHDVISAAKSFRDAYKALVTKVPHLSIKFVYASKGQEPHPKILRKAEILKKKTKLLFSDATVEVCFLGAKELLELARRQQTSTHQLNIAENPISSNGSAFVCLATLSDFKKFITDDGGKLRRTIFEANVRDYQGKNEVNGAIEGSLRETGAIEDFWWLNNGVTILCTKASHSGKIITIENPEIVNGLQTSRELFNFFKGGANPDKKRHLLVRVIQPSSAESRDKIIKATNSQTSIPTASLRSTEKIHRDIEDYFRSKGLFYDRRKNFYKNDGNPAESIISIPYLAQSVMAIALQRPDSARARPSSLLKSNDEYRKVFSEKHPIQLYEKTVGLMKRIDSYIKTTEAGLAREHQANLRYYIALDVTCSILRQQKPSMAALANLDLTLASDNVIKQSIGELFPIYKKLGASDQAAKGPQLLSRWTKRKQNIQKTGQASRKK